MTQHQEQAVLWYFFVQIISACEPRDQTHRHLFFLSHRHPLTGEISLEEAPFTGLHTEIKIEKPSTPSVSNIKCRFYISSQDISESFTMGTSNNSDLRQTQFP